MRLGEERRGCACRTEQTRRPLPAAGSSVYAGVLGPAVSSGAPRTANPLAAAARRRPPLQSGLGGAAMPVRLREGRRRCHRILDLHRHQAMISAQRSSSPHNHSHHEIPRPVARQTTTARVTACRSRNLCNGDLSSGASDRSAAAAGPASPGCRDPLRPWRSVCRGASWMLRPSRDARRAYKPKASYATPVHARLLSPTTNPHTPPPSPTLTPSPRTPPPAPRWRWPGNTASPAPRPRRSRAGSRPGLRFPRLRRRRRSRGWWRGR